MLVAVVDVAVAVAVLMWLLLLCVADVVALVQILCPPREACIPSRQLLC